MRVLIAEDERITRMTLARQLQAWGHDVTAAEDGQQAWEQFSGGVPFDIVITDWEMPQVSGVELVGRIRKTPRGLYTYIIMLTSRSDKADIVNGIEAGRRFAVHLKLDGELLLLPSTGHGARSRDRRRPVDAQGGAESHGWRRS